MQFVFSIEPFQWVWLSLCGERLTLLGCDWGTDSFTPEASVDALVPRPEESSAVKVKFDVRLFILSPDPLLPGSGNQIARFYQNKVVFSLDRSYAAPFQIPGVWTEPFTAADPLALESFGAAVALERLCLSRGTATLPPICFDEVTAAEVEAKAAAAAAFSGCTISRILRCTNHNWNEKTDANNAPTSSLSLYAFMYNCTFINLYTQNLLKLLLTYWW